MVFGRSNRILITLILLLAITSLAIFWVYFTFHAWITVFNLSVLWLLFVGLIIYHIQRVNRNLTRFFQALRNQDSSVGYTRDITDSGFSELYEQMDLVFKDLGNLKSEKERDFNFFSAIIDHSDVGMIVYDEMGEIILLNNAAKSLLNISRINNLNALIPNGQRLGEIIHNLNPGKSVLVSINHDNELLQLSMRSRKIVLADRKLNLVSLQNIRQELEQNEASSWQKLIRVLVHEITNSVSPITLTASGIIQLLESSEKPDDVKKENILSGLYAIRKRSKGMAAFVESYRQLTRIPTPNFTSVEVQQLFDNLGRLMHDELIKQHIELKFKIAPKEINLWCDEQLVEQILINLLRNASEALVGKEAAEITISCVHLQNAILLTVTDNGPGIEPELMESIFIPFFSTKADGSGIGLSISRQIMTLHCGRISVQSKPGKTSFSLYFPLQNKN
jgi:two-component system, NtrC family, nitrogen regulation sensor histidine kinase NtrY